MRQNLMLCAPLTIFTNGIVTAHNGGYVCSSGAEHHTVRDQSAKEHHRG
jgi:hypothetical protein